MRTLIKHLFLAAAIILAAIGIERAMVANPEPAKAHGSPTAVRTTSAHSGASMDILPGTQPEGKCPLASKDDASAAGSATAGSCSRTTPDPSMGNGAKYISPDSCVQCHEDEVASFRNTTHSRSWQAGIGCEQCHGDATNHIATGGQKGTIISMKGLSPNDVSKNCLNCHQQKGGMQGHAALSEHYRAGVACTSCHEVHPSNEHKSKLNIQGKSAMLKGMQTELCLSCHTTVAADFNKPTHHRLLEGIMSCTSCHNPHGTTEQNQLKADTKTLCVSCHQDKRGPYLYEHNAMDLDGCLACHDNHGSSARNMLKDRDERALCVSCHSKETGIGVPHGRGPGSLQAMGDCTRCHNDIHGSNKNQYFVQ